MNTLELSSNKSMGSKMDGMSKDQLIADFKVVVADAEALLKETANQSGEKLAEVRAKAEESLAVVKASLENAQTALLVKGKAAAKATDAYVHENPWKAIGAAAGAGLLIGMLLRRR